MVTASVGFQCPECTKKGAKQQRLVDVHRRATEPVLTYALIAINVAVYLFGIVAGDSISGRYGNLTNRYGLWPLGVGEGEWWRLITSGFLHASPLHIAFNMFALYSLGGVLERTIGRAKFGLIYAVSLAGGSLGVVLLAGAQDVTVGASGAIFGLFGAFAVLMLSRGQSIMQGGIGGTILLNLVITFAIPGISIGGHLGGLITGAICGAALMGTNPTQARQLDAKFNLTGPAVAALGVVMFAIAIVAAPSITALTG